MASYTGRPVDPNDIDPSLLATPGKSKTREYCKRFIKDMDDCRETTPGWRRLLGACNEASIALHKCLIEANDIMRKQYRAASLEHHKERLEHEEKQRRAKESKERESSERL